ncbi:alpha/beta hydrolase [Phenylobacterium hankyongense]|uniref:Alpha/beta hydrolase n=1 Tax=Phenylobacterium hankyongense TaxID=1813876 RepID=A0A328AYJ5_9CAUL|nr:alpha/beta fold hydrolase [Phenylobacterium hankyongense]RAK59719.1 alpha/beta hydrolase [Phenylobacterium hankyongense]
MTSIVMVHGAFCGGWAFERLRTPFEAAGFAVHTPDLRGHAAADGPDRVIGVSMADYAADVAALCESLPGAPILVGHSMGGLVAQMAARRAKLQALVLLAPTPPWGVAGSSLEEGITALGIQMMSPFSSGAVEPDAGLMRSYSLDRMPAAEREAVIRRLKPESGRAVREALNWWLDPFMTTSVGPGRLAAPALAIAGELDVVHPPATVRQTAERIGATFEVMPQMSHWLPGEPGWEDIADSVLRWLSDEARAAA